MLTTETPDLLTPRQAAAVLHVTAGTLAIWRCKKRYPLRYVKVGRKVLYRRADLITFLTKRTVER